MSSGRDMTLDQLFAGIATLPAIEVTNIALDARLVEPGGLYLARKGLRRHGMDYVDQALARGVRVVAYEPPVLLPSGVNDDVIFLPVARLGQHLGLLASRFFGAPATELTVDAVTGTNGKTTVAWLVAEAQRLAGVRSGYLGTLGWGVLPELDAQSLTTPDVIEVSRKLRQLLAADVSHATLEASSHALDQQRLAGLSIRGAIFTNLSHDHLDYHGTLARYFAAKSRLFERPEVQIRIINVDSPAGVALARRHRDAICVTRAKTPPAGERFVQLHDLEATPHGQKFNVTTEQGRETVETALLGAFNVDNLGCALALLLAEGMALTDACDLMTQVDAPPGRMQRVQVAGAPLVVIDFAHTPAALGLALRTLRSHAGQDLWCVFGCGGDRDKDKRPLMGEIASRLADQVVITSDNPRSEPPARIIDAIAEGTEPRATVTKIEDRRIAIETAINQAGAQDLILIAGKGHESEQVLATQTQPFDDAAVARDCLQRRAA